MGLTYNIRYGVFGGRKPKPGEKDNRKKIIRVYYDGTNETFNLNAQRAYDFCMSLEKIGYRYSVANLRTSGSAKFLSKEDLINMAKNGCV